MGRLFLLLTTAFLMAACSDNAKETELQNQISTLRSQLDECKNGANKMLAKIKIAFEKEKLDSVKSIYSNLQNQHPESTELMEAKIIYEKVIEAEKEKKSEAERIARKELDEILKALNRLKKTYDDISGITWYKQPYFAHYTNSNLTSIYLGDNGTNKWLRLMMSYHGEDWIFFERAYLSYDGKTKEIMFDKYDDKETENNGGGVWEWIDLTVTKDVEQFLREFAKSDNAKMRLTGKYTRTRNLTRNERQGILDVLKGYDALKKGVQ